MDRLHLMSVFVAVVEAGGFAPAARRLRMSPPAVTRAIALLENHLGVRLLTRTTRHVRVTDTGTRYAEDARRILADVDEADAAAAGAHATPRGQLAVTAPVLLGRICVMPVITAYQAAYPQMTVSALFVDRVVNLGDEGLDVAVRVGELPDSGLRAIPVGSVHRVVCASPAYLAAHGTPRTPADLADHALIAATTQSPGGEWIFGSGKARQRVRVTPRLLVNTNDGAIEAARQGFGLTRLLSYQVARDLAAGLLTEVLTEFAPPRLPVHVIHREGRRESAKVRQFVDLAVARLRQDPALG